MPVPATLERARRVFLEHDGVLHTAEALKAGVHPRVLYAMRDQGLLEVLARGVFRLADRPPLSSPDLVTVAQRVPQGVFCLLSALSFHELTTQIPQEVHVAVARGAWSPRLVHPPIRVYWFAGQAFTEGIEVHEVDGVPLRVYSPEKTLADCFKYRNKIGMDALLEALKRYRERRSVRVDALLQYARICRVEHVARPYLEALL